MSDQDKLREIKEALKAGSKEAKDALVDALDVLDGEEPVIVPEPAPELPPEVIPEPAPELPPEVIPEPAPELPPEVPAEPPVEEIPPVEVPPELPPEVIPEPLPPVEEPAPELPPEVIPEPIPELPPPAILVQELPEPAAVEVFALSISLPANFLDILKEIIAKMGGSIG